MTMPPDETVVSLPLEDLALRVLRYFADEGWVNRHNLTNEPSWTPSHGSGLAQMMKALAEAYDWLAHRGLVALDPASSGGWGFITRRGGEFSRIRSR